MALLIGSRWDLKPAAAPAYQATPAQGQGSTAPGPGTHCGVPAGTPRPHLGKPQGLGWQDGQPPESLHGGPTRQGCPWHPCTGVPQGTAIQHLCMGVPQVTITPDIPTWRPFGGCSHPASPHGCPSGHGCSQHPAWGSLGYSLLQMVSPPPGGVPQGTVSPAPPHGGLPTGHGPPCTRQPLGTIVGPGPIVPHGDGVPLPVQGWGAGCGGGRAGSSVGGGARRGRCFCSVSCQAVSPEKP